MEIDRQLGLFTPILYVSDFWHLLKDLTLLDQTNVEKVIAGNLTIDEETSLAFDGNLTLTYHTMPVAHLIY